MRDDRAVGDYLHWASIRHLREHPPSSSIVMIATVAVVDQFVRAFDIKEEVKRIRIDVSRAHFWDITAIGALDKVVLKLRRAGIDVGVVGLNAPSAAMVERFALHDKGGDVRELPAH